MIRKVKSDSSFVYFDNEYNPIVLPTLFSMSLNFRGKIFIREKKKDIDTSMIVEVMTTEDISALTIEMYENELRTFLEWFQNYVDNSESNLSAHHHHNANNDTLNIYLNDELIVRRMRSYTQVNKARSALTAYYNYLAVAGIIADIGDFNISPELKQYALDNAQPRSAHKYISQPLRNELMRNSKCLRDRLILQLGAEVGLRACEVKGLRINDFKQGTNKHAGFLSLFAELRTEPEKKEFKFLLQGKYSKGKRAKGGESRVIYLHRTILQSLKRYYDEERPETCTNDTLIVTKEGDSVKTNLIDKIFRENRNNLLKKFEKAPVANMQKLEKGHTYHNLRHSYGTDQFDYACQEQNIDIDAVSTTSPPYLYVAALLGHSKNSREAAPTTARYIHSVKAKRQLSQG